MRGQIKWPNSPKKDMWTWRYATKSGLWTIARPPPKKKTCQTLAVLWHFLIFCCFCGRFLRIFNPIFGFLIIKCWMKYAEWPIYATSEHKTELWKITKNEIVLPPKHGAPHPPTSHGHQYQRRNSHLVFVAGDVHDWYNVTITNVCTDVVPPRCQVNKLFQISG